MWWRLDEVRVSSQLIWPISAPLLCPQFKLVRLVLYKYNILYFGIKMQYGTGFFTDNWRAVLVCEVEGKVLGKSYQCKLKLSLKLKLIYLGSVNMHFVHFE